MNLNKSFILGRVTQDPRVRNLPSGQLVASFSVATNRYFTDKQGQKREQAEFHNIVAFGKTAEIAQQYLKQGSMVLIEGRLQTRSWEGKDGVKRYQTEIVVESLQLGPRPQGVSSSGKISEGTATKEVKKEEIPTVEEDEIDVKDLPL
ncbi:MAG: single-stranded DNA-binding protein [Patescibacteria group bacterium]